VAGDQRLRRQDPPQEVPEQGPAPLQQAAVWGEGPQGPWEVHRDPYDVSRIWVRNHHDGGGWIEATWTHLNTGPVPFGDLAWDHAQRMLARRGIDKPTEDEIAQAASDLLTRAGKGSGTPAADLSPQDQRAAALTRATTSAGTKAAWPGSGTGEDPEAARRTTAPAVGREQDEDDEEGQLAPVIPLAVFDAAKEAKKRW
jgi:hypothetical protein